MSDEIPTEWYFITPPQSVSWSKGSKVNMIEPYGTNNPYVNYGTTQLRQLKLGNAMIEGFSAGGMVVEDNIHSLEACMRMVLESDDGFTAPYVWNVYAGDKSYGQYVITSVDIDESIRNVAGQANRATANISFQQVSPYQVSSGIDIKMAYSIGVGCRASFLLISLLILQASSKFSKVRGSYLNTEFSWICSHIPLLLFSSISSTFYKV